MKQFIILFFITFLILKLHAQQASSIVFEDENGFLRYVADQENNYIPDFSQVGYKNGEAPLPEVPVVKTLGPIAGDNTARIQAALDQIALTPLNANGIRGALLLEPGVYEVRGVVTIRQSGIVLRGSGEGENPDSNTIIKAPGNSPSGRSVVRAGYASGVSWSGAVPGSRSQITSEFVPAGSRSLEVSAPELYHVGDQVIIYQPSTRAWLESVHFGDTDVDDPWAPGEIDIYYNRYITAVNVAEHKITLDVPIYDHLDRSLAQSEIYILDESDIKYNIGIENLRIDIQTSGEMDENHASNAVRLNGVEDCWVRNVTALHFTFAAVDMSVANRVTVLDCSGLEPNSLIEGSRRYNFAVSDRCNNILFKNCHTTRGRHSFVSNGTSSASGIVAYNCNSEYDYNSSEGHRRWSQGMLFDNITYTNAQAAYIMGLYNRGSYGTGHGWAAVNSVAWNVKTFPTRQIILQKPPGRQNYAIACQAVVTNEHQFQHPKGFEELTNQTPLITSLYATQLEKRLQKGIPPDGPARLKAISKNGIITLSWLDIASNETGYIIESSTDGGAAFNKVTELPANTTTYKINNALNEVNNLMYRVYAIGANCPSPYSNPAMVQVVAAPLWEQHWNDTNYEFSGSGGDALTVSKTACEEGFVQVTDPTNAPLPAFSPIIINPLNENGDKITSISDTLVTFTMRARSAARVVVGVLFRSGDGTADFRTKILYDTIPAGLNKWTEITWSFTGDDLGGFDPNDLRDVWFFLDRGTENFAGNEFYIDYITIGGPPTAGLESPCTLVNPNESALYADYFDEAMQQSVNTGSIAGQVTTFTLDTACETLQLSITDPVNNPLPTFNAYQVEPVDTNGNKITDITGKVNVTMRVRSAGTVNVDILFRSGEGTSAERSDRKTVMIPGGLDDWTTFTVEFSDSELAGFNPADLRDLWFYLDRGVENFNGNAFYMDHIAIGGAPDTTRNSPCTTVATKEPQIMPFFIVYPNPVSNQLIIKFDDYFTSKNNHQLKIYDPLGRILLQRIIPFLQNQIIIDTKDLPDGLFYLQIKNEQYQFTEKIIRQ